MWRGSRGEKRKRFTFFCWGSLTVSPRLVRALRICAAAMLVDVFSNAYIAILLVFERLMDNVTEISRLGPVRIGRIQGNFVADSDIARGFVLLSEAQCG